MKRWRKKKEDEEELRSLGGKQDEEIEEEEEEEKEEEEEIILEENDIDIDELLEESHPHATSASVCQSVERRLERSVSDLFADNAAKEREIEDLKQQVQQLVDRIRGCDRQIQSLQEAIEEIKNEFADEMDRVEKGE